jgi:acyl dehydratase
MALDHSLVGVRSAPVDRSWNTTDAILYALGVGAGADDPTTELAFTTENTAGVEQQVLPTFAVLVAAVRAGRRRLGDFDPAKLVHAEQAFELHATLPVSGTVQVISGVTAIQDKGSGALVTTENTAELDGRPLVTTRSSAFIRGEGGFGRGSGQSDTWTLPDRSPDTLVSYRTRPDQALLYRLSGDRNPLHSDPAFAARGGFDRPILHGLCTYGFTGRALLHAVCGSDPKRFGAMSGRFSRPVVPGQELVVSIWTGNSGPDDAIFRTSTADGTVVIDRGRFRLR